MTRRALFRGLAAPLLPAAPITTELPDWVRVPGDDCLTCGVNPKGAEGTIYCAGCLAYWRVERVRLQPSKGDVVLGPDGARVEVTSVWDGEIVEEPTIIVYYKLTKPGLGTQQRQAFIDTWRDYDGWDVARLA